MKLEKKTVEYTGIKDIRSISDIKIEIAGLKHLIQEVKTKIKANEQLMVILEEAQKENSYEEQRIKEQSDKTTS
jgi:hypothetical protein